MRVALIAVAAAVAVALFLLLSLNRPVGPAIGEGRAATAPEADTAATAAALPAAPGQPEPELEVAPEPDVAAAEIPLPGATGADATGLALEERYRRSAEEARERVARLSRPGGPVAEPPRRLDPYAVPDQFPELMQERWRETVGELLYPPGHPRAGRPLDHVTAEQLARAASDFLNSLVPGGAIDSPVHPVRLQMSFRDFNALRGELGDGPELANAIKATPPDLDEPIYDPYYIPTTVDDPDVTTIREDRYQRNLEGARELIESTRGRDS